MSEICAGNSVEGSLLSAGGQGAARCRAARRLTNGLRLAAAPTFAAMALLAGLGGDGAPADLLCQSAAHSSLFSGMVPMYLLMSAFHLPPWVKLLFSQGNGANRA
jgi:hypothetical protein